MGPRRWSKRPTEPSTPLMQVSGNRVTSGWQNEVMSRARWKKTVSNRARDLRCWKIKWNLAKKRSPPPASHNRSPLSSSIPVSCRASKHVDIASMMHDRLAGFAFQNRRKALGSTSESKYCVQNFSFRQVNKTLSRYLRTVPLPKMSNKRLRRAFWVHNETSNPLQDASSENFRGPFLQRSTMVFS